LLLAVTKRQFGLDGLLLMGEVKVLNLGVARMKRMCAGAKGSVWQIIQHFRGNWSCMCTRNLFYGLFVLLQLTLVGLLNIGFKLTRYANVGWVGLEQGVLSSTLLLSW